MSQRLLNATGVIACGLSIMSAVANSLVAEDPHDRTAVPSLLEKSRWKIESGFARDALLTRDAAIAVFRPSLGQSEVWRSNPPQLLWQSDLEFVDARLSRDENELVGLEANDNPRIVRLSLRDGKKLGDVKLDCRDGVARGLRFAPGGAPWVVAAVEFSDGWMAFVFDAKEGKRVAAFNCLGTGDFNTIAVSADGQKILRHASGGADLYISEGKRVKSFKFSGIGEYGFLSAKHALAWGSVLGGKLFLLDLENSATSELPGHKYQLKSFAYTPDGRWGVSGGKCRFESDRNYYFRSSTAEGGDLLLWDLAQFKPVAKLNPSLDSIGAVAISDDGAKILVAENGDSEGVAILIDVRR